MKEETKAGSTIQKKIKKSAITVDRIYVSDYQKPGTKRAQLRQEIETEATYPSVQPKSGGLFSIEEFSGVEGKTYKNKETRVAFIDVPEEISAKAVVERLSKLPKAALVKVISNAPILDGNQRYALSQGTAEMETFANSQVLRYPVDSEHEGMLIPDKNGKIQYKVVNFEPSVEEGQDLIDLRNADPADYWATPELEAELEDSLAVVSSERGL